MTKTIHVLNKAVELHQLENGFKSSIDAVLLAAACPAKAGERVLDLGCGVGTAGLCLLRRVPGAMLTGIDIQKEALALAEKNAALNGFEDRAAFTHADVTAYREEPADHVICNPPFLEAGTHLTSPEKGLARARGHEDNINLQDWIDAAFHNLKQLGSLTIIHRADHSDKIIQALGKRFGAIEMIPFWPKQDVPAKRVLIRAAKNRKTPALIHPGLILHNDDGSYTERVEKILRDGQGLALH